MKPERWQQLNSLYNAALQMAPEKRKAFLQDACRGDEDLRREAETLLSCDDKAGKFMDAPALEVAGRALARQRAEAGQQDLTGRTLAHYRISEKIGEGGMGVVYKARDSHLDRVVALKILPPEKVADTDRKRRFVQEAKAASALNHPNIVTIHDIAQDDGTDFIAMEYVEGKTLDRLMRGKGLPLANSLKCAVQVADALATAHAAGIVHRDLKPANILVTEKGLVKVVDFGLAKLTEVADGGGSAAVETRQSLTEEGMIVGTAAYMSPEQAQGLKVDARSDIFSFGSVLYEMVTGRRAFKGESNLSTLSAILHQEPMPAEQVVEGLPQNLERLITRCLRKDPDRRFQHMGDVKLELEELAERESDVDRAEAVEADAAREMKRLGQRPWSVRRMRLAAFMFTLLTIGIGIGIGLWIRGPASAPETPLRKFWFAPADRVWYAEISPDGKHVAYTSGMPPTLWILDLDSFEPRQIEGTEGALFPFWHPESKFVAVTGGGSLKRVSPGGGPVVKLCDIPAHVTGPRNTWLSNGDFLVVGAFGGRDFGLVHAGEGGWEPLPVGPPILRRNMAGDLVCLWRAMGGKRIGIYLVEEDGKRSIHARDLESGSEVEVPGPGGPMVYSPTGHLITEDLMAYPVSPQTLRLTGEPFPIAPNGRWPSLSGDGTLVYLDRGHRGVQLVWYNRNGERLGECGQPQEEMGYPSLSPDGRSVAVGGKENGNGDIWLHSASGGIKTRLTFEPGMEHRPIWSPDGTRIAYFARGESDSIDIMMVDIATGKTEPLVATERNESPSDWSKSTGHLIYNVQNNQAYLLPSDDNSGVKTQWIRQSPFDENNGKVSPDGRFMVYCSTRTGVFNIYVTLFPAAGREWRISPDGGTQPRWSGDGKEIFYVRYDTMYAVPVTIDPVFSSGTPRSLFSHPGLVERWPEPRYDVTADGQRFVVTEAIGGEREKAASIRIVQNWYAEFR